MVSVIGVMVGLLLAVAAAQDAAAHSTQACLNSAAAKSAVSVAIAECEAKAQTQLDAKDVQIAQLQAELTAIKTALPCQRIVYNPDDLTRAQQQPGPICVVIDLIKTCTTEACDGYWYPEPTKRRAPVRMPAPKAPLKPKAAPKAAPQ